MTLAFSRFSPPRPAVAVPSTTLGCARCTCFPQTVCAAGTSCFATNVPKPISEALLHPRPAGLAHEKGDITWLLDALERDDSFLMLEPAQHRQRAVEGIKRLLVRESPFNLCCSCSRICTESMQRPRGLRQGTNDLPRQLA
jgi:hypothetical protein